MKYMIMSGIRKEIPPYPHHKNFIYRSNLLFKADNLFDLLTINGPAYAIKRRLRYLVNGFPVPYLLLIDPTSACNLRCKGCWASDYNKKKELTYQKLDEILTEASKLGVWDITFSGGEPLLRKDDIVSLCRKHKHLSFSMFTNGTLIDEVFADILNEIGNLNVYLSIEGFREKTDYRRGDGTFEKVVNAMSILKSRDIGFGFSVCYHAKNFEEVCSDAFLDFIREKGAWFGWMFNYMPIGSDADIEFVLKSQDRRYVKEKIEEYVKKHNFPIFDFPNMGHMAIGCVAAGNDYTHINANGDVEPCAFFHYSDSNINEKSLRESLASPFFRHFRQNKPNKNPFSPCPIMDDPDCLLKITDFKCVHSTHLNDSESAEALYEKTNPIALQWAPVAVNLTNELTDAEKKKLRLMRKYLLFKDKD